MEHMCVFSIKRSILRLGLFWYRALMVGYRALVKEYRALLIEYSTLYVHYRALLMSWPGRKWAIFVIYASFLFDRI